MARQTILGVLSNAPAHLSAEDLYLEVHEVQPNVGLTTVYRTLDLLVQMGLVCKFDFGDGRARYELCEGPDRGRHHHHLVCTKCGEVQDLVIDPETEKRVASLIDYIADDAGYVVSGHRIDIEGECSKCMKS